jgi:hypothetical protein
MLVAAVFSLTSAVGAMAQDAAPAPPPAPSADEINRVTAYYLGGKDGGPVLIEFRLCGAIGKNDQGKMACDGELGATAKKGDVLNAFVKFFAPKGGKYDDLKVKFLHNGEIRTTSDFTVSESWTGYANYKRTTLSKPGTWEVEVLRGDVVLQKKSITVE